jgi:anaerobic carbon-monoxide dehydrogenase iron sulfur subunit
VERRLEINPKLCIGCKTCELSCSFAHAGADHTPGKSRIQVFQTGPQRYFQLVCLQCEDAACLKSCPVGAITLNERTGAVVISSEKCVHCQACVIACPFGNMYLAHPQGVPVKCDLCGGDPLCAKYCPSKALQYVLIRRIRGTHDWTRIAAAAAF